MFRSELGDIRGHVRDDSTRYDTRPSLHLSNTVWDLFAHGMGPVASRNCAALYSIVGAWRVLFIYVAVNLTNLQRDIPLAIWVRYEYCTAYTRMLRPNALIFTSMLSRNLERLRAGSAWKRASKSEMCSLGVRGFCEPKP
jgi:hypothetical protein